MQGNSVNDNGVKRCESDIEDEHIGLIDAAVARGWSERQVAIALLNRAIAHLQLLDGIADNDVMKAVSG